MKSKRLFTSLILGLGLTLAFLWLLAAGPMSQVHADTYTVTTTDASGPGSLRQAIIDANANPGHDTIGFGITGAIVLTDALPVISDDLTIAGPGAVQLAVSGDNQFRVFYIESSTAVTMTGITVRDGHGDNGGGGIWSEGNLHLDSVQIVNNTAIGVFPPEGRGGGVYARNGSLTMNRSQVFENSVSGRGGFGGFGGGVFVHYGSATLSGTQVSNNSAQLNGGGVHIELGNATLNGTQVSGNSATYSGGGVVVIGSNATLNVSGGVIDNNYSTSLHGGGVFISRGSATLNGTRVISNSAADNGGGVFVFRGSAALNGTQVVSNSASDGGGVYLNSSGVITAINGCIVFNSDTAVNRVDGTLTATDNWWGTLDGPGGDGPGSGDTVSAGVDYANFKIAAPAGCPSRFFLAPEITVTPTDPAFGDQDVDAGPTVSQTVTITNDGNADLHIRAITQTGDIGEFNLVDSGEITLTSGSTRTIKVSFDPSSIGGKVVTLTIQSDDSDESTVNVALSGTGIDQEITIAPSSLDFGEQDVDAGATVLQTVTITNDGNADLHIRAITQTGDTGEFNLVDSGEITLTSGSTRTIKVSFDPSSVGVKSITLTIESDDSDEFIVNVALTGTGAFIAEITVDPLSLAFGDQDVDAGPTVSQTVTITNDGSADLYVSSISLTGGDAAHFQIESGGSPVTLTQGSTYTVQVSFDPTTTGAKSANLSIVSDDGDEPTVDVALGGTGIAPEITVAPASLAFGDQDVDAGPTVSQTVTITNDGSADLHISTVTPTGDTGEFNLLDSGEATLTPGGTRAIEVSFDPSSVGAKAITLTIQSDDADEPTVDVTLTGTGVDQEITVTPTGLSFGSQDVDAGPTVSQTVTITNDGTTDLHISAVSPTGDTDEFNLDDSGIAGNGAITLTPGSTRAIEVSFDPSSVGTKVMTLTIHSNDSDEPTVEVILSGTGTMVSQPGYGSDPAPGSSIDVGTANVGSTISATLTISETGAATLVVTPALSGPNAADFGFTPSTLTIPDGGAAQDLTISCTPSVTGTLAATLTVAHNAPGSAAVYALSCSGEALYYIYLPLLLRNN